MLSLDGIAQFQGAGILPAQFFLNASPYGIAQLNGKAGVRKRCQKSYHTLSASIDFFH